MQKLSLSESPKHWEQQSKPSKQPKRLEQVYLHENASQKLNWDLAAGLEKVERFTNFG